MKDNKKKCTKCKRVKDKSEFGKRATGKEGLSSTCTDCTRRNKRAYYKKNPEASQDSTIAWKARNVEQQKEYGKNYRLRKKNEGG
jgi:hypothetical protein